MSSLFSRRKNKLDREEFMLVCNDDELCDVAGKRATRQ